MRFLLRMGGFSAALILVGGASAGEPLNLSVAKEAVLHYVDTGSYAEDLAMVSGRASAWIEERVSQKMEGEKLALVLDIDETALSNLTHMRGLDFGYVPREWDVWVEDGSAPAIEPVLRVFQTAQRLGVKVFFITGRQESDRPGTEKNLVAAGFADYQALICLPAGQAVTAEQFKTAERRQLEQAGWTIIANVGDQESDLAGGSAERIFKLPNPFYLTP